MSQSRHKTVSRMLRMYECLNNVTKKHLFNFMNVSKSSQNRLLNVMNVSKRSQKTSFKHYECLKDVTRSQMYYEKIVLLEYIHGTS